MQKIVPFIWFDNNAEEALNFYTTVFKDSKIVKVSRYGKGAPMPEGTLFSGTFQLFGQDYYVLNGGPMFTKTEAISLFINCDTQTEVDEYWDKLSEGGKPMQCGWLTDKFGLTWQVIPTLLGKLLGDKDPAKAQRVMQAMMKMVKIESDKLQEAYDQQ